MAILSIQSHVAYGYAGNKAATFPLQRLGYEVFVINTVQFSNHTGYGKWRGEVFSATHIQEIIKGLIDLEVFSQCNAILSGYLGQKDIGYEVLRAVTLGREYHSDLIYACDPVMGDRERGIFVKPDIPEFMCQHAVPSADLLTPNHFEMELLTQQTIDSIESAKQACNKLRAHPQQVILITSFKRDSASSNTSEIFLSAPEGYYIIATPYLPFDIAPTGTGDLFSALLLGHYLKARDAIAALEATVSTVYSILAYTLEHKMRELQIVAGQAYLKRPTHQFYCEKL